METTRFTSLLTTIAILASFTALPASAHHKPWHDRGSSSGTGVTLRHGTGTTLDVACIQGAINKRDNAIIAAWETFSSAMKTALQNRKDALNAAWAMTNANERKKALKQAWKNFKDVRKAATKVFRKSKNDAWKQFKTERKTCGGSTEGEEGGEGHDELQMGGEGAGGQ